MGGINIVARMLGVPAAEIDRWTDEHYIPQPFAGIVSKHTGYSINALQRPTFYVFDGGAFWPRPPMPEEWEEPTGPRIYMPAHWT